MMYTPELVREICETITSNIDIDLSVKCRIGVDGNQIHDV